MVLNASFSDYTQRRREKTETQQMAAAQVVSLFYPAAGTDASFVELPCFSGVQRFVLCDTLPNSRQFRYDLSAVWVRDCGGRLIRASDHDCRCGAEFYRDEDGFVEYLAAEFEDYGWLLTSRVGNQLSFRSEDAANKGILEYRMNTDANTFDISAISPYALYIRGFVPTRRFDDAVKVFRACDSHDSGYANETEVHPIDPDERDCFCDYLKQHPDANSLRMN